MPAKFRLCNINKEDHLPHTTANFDDRTQQQTYIEPKDDENLERIVLPEMSFEGRCVQEITRNHTPAQDCNPVVNVRHTASGEQGQLIQSAPRAFESMQGRTESFSPIPRPVYFPNKFLVEKMLFSEKGEPLEEVGFSIASFFLIQSELSLFVSQVRARSLAALCF